MFWWKLLQAAWAGFSNYKTVRLPVGGRSQPSQERIVVLLITQDDSLRHSLFALGHVYRWEAIAVPTLNEAIALLTERQIPLVICDEEAPEDWRKTVRSIAFLPQSTCILLASPASRDSLLREVDRHHGYDVIAKPLRFQEVADRVSFAWTWYKSGRATWWGPPRTSALLPPYRGGGGLDGH